MLSTLAAFLADMDGYTERIPLDVLERRLAVLDLTVADVSEFVRFGTTSYRRNVMHVGAAYQALILCWRNGQRSPIHDHRGSSCGVRILHGCATETVYRRNAGGMIVETGSRVLHASSVCASQDTDIHQMSNLERGGSDLITLHVYSPPLLRMGTYSLHDGSVEVLDDPIHA